MSLSHATILLLGFLCCEAGFSAIEHWFKGREEKFRRMKHAAFLTWMFHPAALNASAEWANHLFAVVLTAGGH